jgi:hypothetical protein
MIQKESRLLIFRKTIFFVRKVLDIVINLAFAGIKNTFFFVIY